MLLSFFVVPGSVVLRILMAAMAVRRVRVLRVLAVLVQLEAAVVLIECGGGCCGPNTTCIDDFRAGSPPGSKICEEFPGSFMGPPPDGVQVCCNGNCQDASEACSSSSSSSSGECVSNQNCCMFIGEYFMYCSDAENIQACEDSGGVFDCWDDPYGSCRFDAGSFVGTCDSFVPPFPPSGNYPIFGPYGFGDICTPSNSNACIRQGYCCDGECQGKVCS